MNSLFLEDYYQYTGGKEWSLLSGTARLIKGRGIRICLWGRLAASENKVKRFIGRVGLWRAYEKYGIEINFKYIAGGVVLIHPFDIVVTNEAKIGRNCTLYKGVTIGGVRTGKREGSPVLGDGVAMMPGSCVVGNARIGNNVLIAANAMVDVDIPDNALAFGNPAVIKQNKDIAKQYGMFYGKI